MRIIFGITGASGAIYAKKSLEYLSKHAEIHLIISDCIENQVRRKTEMTDKNPHTLNHDELYQTLVRLTICLMEIKDDGLIYPEQLEFIKANQSLVESKHWNVFNKIFPDDFPTITDDNSISCKHSMGSMAP